jgi:hypothetical protein
MYRNSKIKIINRYDEKTVITMKAIGDMINDSIELGISEETRQIRKENERLLISLRTSNIKNRELVKRLKNNQTFLPHYMQSQIK